MIWTRFILSGLIQIRSKMGQICTSKVWSMLLFYVNIIHNIKRKDNGI
jgi:hypothetical protein